MSTAKNEFDWIKDVKWIKLKERDIDIALESFYTKGYTEKYFKKLGVNFGIGNQLVFGDGRIFFDQKDIDKAIDLLLEKKNKLPEYALKITNNYITRITKFKHFLKKYKKTNFHTISKVALKKIYTEFIELIYGFIPQAFIVSEILEKIATEKIVATLKKVTRKPELLYTKLVTPTQSSNIGKEYMSRLSLALKLKQKQRINKELKKHLKKFGWIALYSPMDELLTENVFLKNIEKLSKKPDLISELKLAKNKQQELKKTSNSAWNSVKLTPNDRLLVRVMQKNAWIRTYRRELVSQGFYQMRPLYLSCAQKLNIDFSDLRQIACWEISEYLNNPKKIPYTQIKERKHGYIFLQQKNKIQIISGKLMSKIFDPEKKLIFNSNLSGLPIYHGLATGPVRIVHKKDDLINFQKGDILVAPTVGTWMMPAVEKCAAIITDAGGVLSHTSIVAREFRKPCIVATKNATKILKNGQIVTIDTKKNIIK